MADAAVEHPPVAEAGKDVVDSTTDTKDAEETTDEPVIKTETAPEKPGEEDAAMKEEAEVKSEESKEEEKVEVKIEPNSNDTKDDEKKTDEKKKTERPPPKYKNWSQNIKSDYSNLPETSDPAAIRKQVEFYFSDSNLAQDKFLYTQIEGVTNKPVSVKMVHSFKRMRRFQPFSAVVAALKDSETLDLVDDDTAIQRKTPLSEDFEQDDVEDVAKVHNNKSMGASIYAKGFGKEGPSTQTDIEAFFADFGPTNQVRLRRDLKKNFKGSVFVEFSAAKLAQQFLALDPKPKYNGNELLIKSKKQYCDDKVDDINAGRVRPNEKDGEKDKGKRDDNRDWRERRNEDARGGFRGGRGGRGRGRGGGRGNGRGGRGGRDDRRGRDDRNKERGEKANKDIEMKEEVTEKTVEKPAAERPVAKEETTTNGASEKVAEKPIAAESKKRSRDDNEESSEQAPAKKQKEDAVESLG